MDGYEVAEWEKQTVVGGTELLEHVFGAGRAKAQEDLRAEISGCQTRCERETGHGATDRTRSMQKQSVDRHLNRGAKCPDVEGSEQ